jgi:hypothetical protein
LKLSVKTHANAHIEPIDSLQVLFGQVHDCSTTGITGHSATARLMIHPNPAKDEITLTFSSSLAGSRYSITDLYGRNLVEVTLRAPREIIDIRSLAPGIYLVKAGNFAVMKFVKRP